MATATKQPKKPAGAPNSEGGQFDTVRKDADTLGPLAIPAPVRGTERMAATLAPSGGYGPYTVAKYKSMTGREGEAFSFEIHNGKRVIAHVHNDGNGGQTLVRYTGPEARDEFRAFVDEHWAFAPFDDFGDDTHDDHQVADVWAIEIDTRKTLRSQRGRKNLPIVTAADIERQPDGIIEYSVLTNAVGREHLLHSALKDQADGALYFDGDNWVPIP